MAVERLPQEKGKFVIAFAQTFKIAQACAEARVRKEDAEKWLDEPEVRTAIRLISDKASQSQGVSYAYLLSQQKEILERCMQQRPVTDRKGQVIVGEYTFDAFNANKAVENLAKLTGHIGSGAINVNVNVAQMSEGQRMKELDKILKSLEARATAGIVDAEFKELPSPEPEPESIFE